MTTLAPSSASTSAFLSAEVVTALAELRAEIGVDQRLRSVETTLAGVLATMAAQQRPSQIPGIVSSVVAVVSVLVAVVAVFQR